jgi:hypothetical protein
MESSEGWADEFGKEVADKLRIHIENAMDDHEYLNVRRLS